MSIVGNDTATTNFNKTVQELISRVLQELLRAGLHSVPPGAEVPATLVKAGNNGTMRFQNVLDLDATPASHAIAVEGVPPAGQELAMGYEEIVGTQYGDFVRLTDLSEAFSSPKLAITAADRIARQMAAVIDNIAKAAWAAGTNVIYSGTGNAARTDVAAGDVFVSSDVKRGVALLEVGNVPRFSDNAYVGIISPYVKFDLELDDDAGGWIDSSKYAGSVQLMNGELGKYAGVRFIVTTQAYVATAGGAGGIDVYRTILCGPKSIAIGDTASKEVFIEQPGGVSDPLHQIKTVGWKAFLAAILVGEGTNATNVSDPRYVAIESASSL